LYLKKPRENGKKQGRELLRALSFFSQIGITMAACVLIGVFLGRFLDNLLGTSPWLLLLFSILGAVAALKAIFDLGQRK
jgi:ATP synthase protein I